MFTRNLPYFNNEAFYTIIMYIPSMFEMYYKFPKKADFIFMSGASETDV